MPTIISMEDVDRIKELTAQLANIRAIEEKVVSELRALIYKIER